ncbi:MAG TPA: RNA polymerase sigma factor [Kofleriaceae bacterium]|nr:RNA polymerase sigma factor [Kofleriaceae bacterium]
MKPIFERYASPLYSTVILPRLGNRAAAEDVLRDTMAAAMEKIDQFRWQGRSIYSWLRMIAVNKAYDVHRRTKRGQKLVDAMAVELPSETLPDERADAKLIADQERALNRERISATLDKITPRYREAIQLRLVEELPRSECATRLEVTVGTFDVLLFRAVRSFRKHFGERD